MTAAGSPASRPSRTQPAAIRSQAVAARTREMGVRLAVGATPAFVLLCAAVFGGLGVFLAVIVAVLLTGMRRG